MKNATKYQQSEIILKYLYLLHNNLKQYRIILNNF